MKKPGQSRVLRAVKNIFNVRYWLDFDRVKSFTLYLANGFKTMFVPQKQERGESFEAAITTLNLTEKDLIAKQKGLYRLSLLMISIAVILFIYAFYHLYYGGYRATVLSLIVMLIALVLAFRYHFWYFQIKQRKLGCTFNEWYKKGLLGGKK